MNRCAQAIIAAVTTLLLAGCEAPPQAAPAQLEHPGADLAAIFATTHGSLAPVDEHPDAVPAHFNSPRAAAQELATLGKAISRQSERRVELHAAMYRAAINADQASHSAYLLVRAADDEQLHDMSERELRLRILATLRRVGMPVMWDDAELAWMLDPRSPGGAAARAWFEVVRRNDELASVEADVCIESARIGTRKYRVEAIYDGQRWTVRDLGARTNW